MDTYTTSTRDWLELRYRATDKSGIYRAHQPIYGFRKGHCEINIVSRYAITYQILKALARLQFESLLDVGGAEGYKAALIQRTFGAEVRNCDLSLEACKRAREIFSVEGEPVDILNLPYDDNSFDVVLCSETLEHVPDIERATKELMRVCRKALVITVPHEPKELIERNIREKIPHAHIHSLDTGSFEFCRPESGRIIARTFYSPWMKWPFVILSGVGDNYDSPMKQFLAKAYKTVSPVINFLFGKRTVALLILFDSLISRVTARYRSIVFVIEKQKGSYRDQPLRRVSTLELIDFHVPYYYLDAEVLQARDDSGAGAETAATS